MKVVAGIFMKDRKILMGKRLADDGFYGGYWEFPGGKVERGETNEQALARELREELECQMTSSQFFHTMKWQYPTKEVDLHFYMVTMEPYEVEKMRSHAHAELRWFTIPEAFMAKILPANIKLLEKLKHWPLG
jgi:8-oxo-dGTP diphosphatase